MEGALGEPKKRSGLTPEIIREKINHAWRSINFSAEMSGEPDYRPFHKSDARGSVVKVKPEDYLNHSPQWWSEVLAFPLDERLEGKCVLNVGSGKSAIGASVRALGANSIDIDPNFQPRGKIKPVNGSISVIGKGQELPFASEKFDEVLLSFVLPVVDDPERILKEALRVVSSYGRIRVYPVVAFVDLRKIDRPGIKFFRRGADDFVVMIEMENIESPKAVLDFFSQENKVCIKPYGNMWEKRLDGYYYDREYDLPSDQWWLGDE